MQCIQVDVPPPCREHSDPYSGRVKDKINKKKQDGRNEGSGKQKKWKRQPHKARAGNDDMDLISLLNEHNTRKFNLLEFRNSFLYHMLSLLSPFTTGGGIQQYYSFSRTTPHIQMEYNLLKLIFIIMNLNRRQYYSLKKRFCFKLIIQS